MYFARDVPFGKLTVKEKPTVGGFENRYANKAFLLLESLSVFLDVIILIT